jgi:osmoprotectant transport system substrate-binding protein
VTTLRAVKAAGARPAAVAAALTILVTGLAACGSKSSVTPGSGEGRPPVTVGYRDTPEQALIGELYAQGLRDKGFSVRIKPNFSDAKAIDSALRSGQIDVYPEYIGVVAQIIGGSTRHHKTADATYQAAKDIEERRGLTLLDPSKSSKNTILVVTTKKARQSGVVAIRALRKKLHNDFTLGGPAELRSRYDGLVGLRQAYDVIPRFKPLAATKVFDALSAGTIDVGAVSGTDPQMLSGNYRALGDKLKIFGFQNVVPVVAKKTLTKEGPAFAAALNGVTQHLGRRAVRRLNSQVQVHHRATAAVAKDFLAQFDTKGKGKGKGKAKRAGTRTTSGK